MQDQRYTVIDVETTGKGILGNRITEICIVVLEGNTIIDKFVSLVNPEQPIPPFITGLTGIEDTMVKYAPKFQEIAARIIDMTTEAIFVAHNVSFDYAVIRGEFKRLGYTFTRKKLCTVRLSRKLIPGLSSYSLGKLCASLSIPLLDRHRAEGDTDATVILFQRLLALDTNHTLIRTSLNARSKEATLPPHLDVKAIQALPTTAGIYFFKNKEGKVIYVGKAKQIQQRVWSHFYDKKNKEYALGQETHAITYETTGNELIALLLEATKIQEYYPKFNRAQKKPILPYRIISYTNRKGILQLAIHTSKTTQHSLELFYKKTDAIAYLEKLCLEFQLCPRYCGLQHTTAQCSHYRIKNCHGVCHDQESIALYNIRVQQALTALSQQQQTYLIKEKGRNKEEQSFVMVEKGIYKGFGYLHQSEQITHFDDLENHIILQQHTYHTITIIKNYLKKQGENNVIYR